MNESEVNNGAMSDHIYTLGELVDLALRSPDVGAVNFNILRVILQTIISQAGLNDAPTDWQPADPSILVESILGGKELPDLGIVRTKVIEESKVSEVVTTKKATPEKEDREEKQKVEEIMRKLEEQKKLEKQQRLDEQKRLEIEEKLEELKRLEREGQLKQRVKQRDSGTMTVQTEMKFVVPDSSDEESDSEDETGEAAMSRFEREGGEHDHSSKGMTAGMAMWQMWQTKKLVKRIEAIEEELSTLVDVVDDIKAQMEAKRERKKYEEGQKRDRAEDLNKEAFEDALDDMGEAIANLALKLKEQSKKSEVISKDILEELCLKASEEELAKCRDPVNDRIRDLAFAVRNLQIVLRDVIYPAAAGITKCMTCGRKAHLSFAEYVMPRSRTASKPVTREFPKQRVTKRKDETKKHELKFTYKSLAKLNEKEKVLCPEEEQQDQRDLGFPDVCSEDEYAPKFEATLEPLYDLNSTVSSFYPLRTMPDPLRNRNMNLPGLRPARAPISLSVVRSQAVNSRNSRYSSRTAEENF